MDAVLGLGLLISAYGKPCASGMVVARDGPVPEPCESVRAEETLSFSKELAQHLETVKRFMCHDHPANALA
jgi:hypothetical protein